MLSIKLQYNHIFGEQVENHIRKYKQKHFEMGNRPDRLLARQLKGVQSDRAVHKISAISCALIIDPKRINDRFLEFYSSKSVHL